MKILICKCCDNPIKHYEKVKRIKKNIYCENCHYQLMYMINLEKPK